MHLLTGNVHHTVEDIARLLWEPLGKQPQFDYSVEVQDRFDSDLTNWSVVTPLTRMPVPVGSEKLRSDPL